MAARHPHAPSATAAATAGPSRLHWTAGETFSGTVAFDEQDQGGVDEEIGFTARERFKVLALVGGVATIRLAVTGWRWRRNTSALLTTSLPGSTTFVVNAAAEIVSGIDWPLPSQLPLPGLDVFAAPLRQVSAWARTDGAGVTIGYQLQPSAARGETTLTWSVVRPQFTRSGDPITTRGRATVTVVSRYGPQGTTASLLSTREHASFQRATQSPAGTTQESGTVLETTVFSMPSG